jgi:hypothetical protein
MTDRPAQGLLYPRGSGVRQSIVEPFKEAINLADTTLPGFAVTEITAINGAGVYASNLTAACSSNYQPTGSFCNKAFSNTKGIMFKHNVNAGATWSSPVVGATGVLVIDLGSVKDVAEIEYYQMLADGKVTAITAYSHPSASSTPVLASASGWVQVHPQTAMSAGGIFIDYAGSMTNPTVITDLTITTRYLKFECLSDNSLGYPGWIELGGVKVFTPELTRTSNEYILEVRETEILDGAEAASWDNLPATTWDTIFN